MSNDEYYKDDEFLEMLNDYEGAVSRDEPVFLDADDLTDIAEYYQQNARYDEADRAISRAIEMEPHALSVLNYQVHQALAEGNVEEAEDFLDQMMERESPEYIYSRAEVMIAKGETDAADRFLRDCLHDVPSDEYQDYVLDVANIYTDYGLSDKAMEWMMRARYDNTDDFKELMARTLFGLGKYEDSERLFNELIDHDPFQKRYWNALASTQFMKEDYSASVTSSEYAIAIDPDDPDAVVSKANGLYRLENYEQALTYFERYSRLAPDDEFGFLHQGSCLINLGRFEDAVRQLNTAEQLAPDDSPYLLEIYEEQAFAYNELHDVESAIRCVDKTDALECDHVDMMVIRGHILLGNGRISEAEQMFRQALMLSPDNKWTMVRILVSLYDNKFVDSAYMLFKRFFTIVDDDWTHGYAYMALCCWDTKRLDEFMTYLKLACTKNPHEARIVLADLFPEGMPPEEYYSYMQKNLNQ